jgi:hypothetical protein
MNKFFVLIIVIWVNNCFCQPNFNHMHHQQPGMVLKTYRLCNYGLCEEPKWVGFFGSRLKNDLKDDESAYKLALKFQTAAIIKGISFVGIPLFLFTGIATINNAQEDEFGKYDSSKPMPASGIFLLGLCGTSFLSYIVTNVVEGKILRKIEKETGMIKVSWDYDSKINEPNIKLTMNF